ncbi:collagen-like triple helix repeat-containing protein [Echinicola salinicaeni]|uniref:collagen-like triple helix repeat-containing protein n=1 Tax=Echinicola salinicaeni TaxID=2762757 RepID=UPI00164621E9|nr:collagen-like protein [Echinicola salinicaeni]
MKKSIKLLYLFIVTILMFTNCREPELPGQMGERGDKGIVGPKGEKGEQGEKGDGGGLDNVFYSEWSRYSFVGLSNGFWRTQIQSDFINTSILEKGKVIVYFKRGEDVFKLDYVKDDESITQRLDVSSIWLYSSFDPSAVQFRYIVVPGDIDNKVASRINFDDYDNVLEIFSIK